MLELIQCLYPVAQVAAILCIGFFACICAYGYFKLLKGK